MPFDYPGMYTLGNMHRLWVVVRAAALGGALLQFPLQAQQAQREKVDLSKRGPQVGDRVPDFALKDQDGRIRNLNSIMGPKGAMLVFLRSADW